MTRTHTSNYHIIPLILALIIACFLPPPVNAQTTVTNDLVNEVSKGLYCPVCESEPLDTCGTQACIDWRAEIRAQLEAGQTKEQIYDNFVSRYGERVLAQPSARGLNLILWFGMPVLLLAAGYYFLTYLRRIAATPEPVKPSAQPEKSESRKTQRPDEHYLQQIEQELDGHR